MAKSDKPIIMVVSAVIPHEKGFLFVKTRKDKKWGLPGGKVDPFEDLRIALPREVAEETGCQIVMKNIVAILYHQSTRGSAIHNISYFGEIVEGEPHVVNRGEILKVESFSLGKARKLYLDGELRGVANLRAVENHLAGYSLPLSTIETLIEQP